MICYILPCCVYHVTRPSLNVVAISAYRGFTLQQTCSAHLHILLALTFPHQDPQFRSKNIKLTLSRTKTMNTAQHVEAMVTSFAAMVAPGHSI